MSQPCARLSPPSPETFLGEQEGSACGSLSEREVLISLILKNNLIVILPRREEMSPHQHSDGWGAVLCVCRRETDR